MVKAIGVFIVVLMLSGSALAGGYIGLWSDGTHTSCSANGVGFYPVEMWVWAKPDPTLGMICADFAVSYPVNVITSTLTKNVTIISVDIGDYWYGYTACMISCQYDWVWIGHQLLYVCDPTQTRCEIINHSDIYDIQFAACTPGYPVYSVPAMPRLWLNVGTGPCADPIAADETSWGAIKSIYK